ncbi:mechanosensitive ion channel protein MscS [Pseudoxanthomonas broegbernensis]|uniref:Small-conductance mechanosensitive channel n=1 Tax=Pseudoxanthomonas broegbernensis TaxID=83619 RepID=A0A7V8GL73_9GAMM|nr:mechanosensitive ion channel family protein [Pseudoxanthomonas broegbernensis]KAF1685544.1 mechanosensitive ion channel protein MscS [Pseudoxanthomonas broegbernensis]MBB6065914.1 small-conductance mechanosensitive channel [Pseudoxanthomonas broegbernensis]
MRQHLPAWMQEWLGTVLPIGQVVLILLAAWLLQRLVRAVVRRLVARRGLPPEMAAVLRRVSATLIAFATILLALERLGVSGTVLWTAFTSFAAVGAVAFFAAWSVLSNIFCSVLIFTTRPFRRNDHIEILENGEKPGLKGRVVDLNLIYTTLQEIGGGADGESSVLQIPNSLFFQRAVRRWRGQDVPSRWRADAADAGTQEQPG